MYVLHDLNQIYSYLSSFNIKKLLQIYFRELIIYNYFIKITLGLSNFYSTSEVGQC